MVLGACAPVVAPAPAEPKVLAPWPSSVRRVPAHECDTEACWEARAQAAAGRGDLDVAAELRGRAFQHAPAPARLDAWADALLAVGATERARGVLEGARRDAARRGDTGWAAAIERRVATLPPPSPERPLTPTAPTEALRAAFLAGGDPAVFIAAGAQDPYYLVHAAESTRARGDEPAARRLWAQARAAYDERGATLQLDVVERSPSAQILWHGELLVHGEDLTARRGAGVGAWALRFLEPDGAVRRRLLFAEAAQQMALVDGGRGLLLNLDGALVQHDIASGLALRRVLGGGADDDDVEDFVAADAGGELRVLARRDETVVLADGAGRELATYPVAAWETWEPRLALGAGGCRVAIGEEGPQIRVSDLCTGAQHVWTYPWPAGSARLGDDRPEVRGVLALGFTPAGDALVAVDNLGEITTWSLPAGRLLRRVPGRCSRAEALAMRDPDDEEPVDAATGLRCGLSELAAVGPDGARVATVGFTSNLRVRTAAGRTLAAVFAADRDFERLAFSATGELAAAEDAGELRRLRPGAKQFVGRGGADADEDRAPGIHDLALDGAGRRLAFRRGSEAVYWDLETGERRTLTPAAGERVLAVLDAGRRAWVRTASAVVLRELQTGAELLRVSTASPAGELRVGRAPPGRALLTVARGDKQWDHHLVGPDGPRLVTLAEQALQLSPDGRWLAAVDEAGALTLWSAATATRAYAAGVVAQRTEFAADGAAVAWSTPWDREARRSEVRTRRLDTPGAVDTTLELSEAPLDLAVSADGAEVLLLLARGLIRWSPAAGHRTEYLSGPTRGKQRLAITGGGATLTLTQDARRLEVVSNDAHLHTLATVVLLESGGWAAIGRAGAVDGSADAPGHLIARVARGDEALVFDGRLGWDGARVPGLVGRAVLGEGVPPPGLVRAAPRDAAVVIRDVLDDTPVKPPPRKAPKP